MQSDSLAKWNKNRLMYTKKRCQRRKCFDMNH
jgi:hypothetical protein